MAIAFERKEQIKSTQQEIQRLSAEEREKKGRAILGLRGQLRGREVGGFYLVRFGRREVFPELEIKVGDIVLVSRGNPLKSDLTGTVTEVTAHSLTVAFSEPPPAWIRKRVRIDLYFNDITFRRMEEALDTLYRVKEEQFPLKRLILNEEKVQTAPFLQEVTFFDSELNSSQKEAVRQSLSVSPLFLIHGPPGTGKTRTVVEYIRQEINSGKKVLAAAESNTACDNLLKLLAQAGVAVVRLGHPARVEKELLIHSLFYLVEKKESYFQAQKLRDKAMKLVEERDRYLKPSPQWRRGMEDQEILKQAKINRSVRGVPARKIREMANWLQVQGKINQLFDQAEKLEELATKEIIKEAEVVIATNVGTGVDYLEDSTFDVVVVDEGSQATEPSSLIPILKGKKAVMSGDHLQLPPTILSEQAQPILSVTLFERMITSFPDLSSFLSIQYRMNEKIMSFSSKKFYQGRLKAHPSVANRSLYSLGFIKKPPFWEEIIDSKIPLVLVDTASHFKKWEIQRKGSTSRENPLEVEIVSRLVVGFSQIGVPEEFIGIITPYDDQVNQLKKKIDGVKISTVDGFQGKEKEVVILSLVRSNQERDLGFLTDFRRLNVSITRARSKLVVVGDGNTISKENLYRDLIKYIKQEGRYCLFTQLAY
ncbi:MAG: hypothetical protein PWP04_700 [Candidatus Atribacteria bacterium]|nr:hypothetical protein [Candidatus Atribacteria bacterium]